MADGSELGRNEKTTENNDSEPSNSEAAPRLCLDLGDDLSHNISDTNRLGCVGTGSINEGHRREDNPFSFKHFLRCNLSNNYQNKGARPKVYCEGRPVLSVSDVDMSNEIKTSRIVPEYSSALPDFVQDHLVIEQCYLGNASNSNMDMNLRDFSTHRKEVEVTHNTNRSEKSHIQVEFPFDLPQSNKNRICVSNEVGNSKSLPDFLADGAVRSSQNSLDVQLESPERECERLRHEVESTQSQLLEQTRCIENLTRELEISRSKEQDYTQNLAKALEQVEKSLEQNNIKSKAAESSILKLKQENRSLEAKIQNLKLENRVLRGEEGAAGGHEYLSVNELQAQRLAQELKAAASTAEHSLRQLLTGVDNLRLMASSLENLHRLDDKNESFLDLDEDSGPAL